MDDSDASCDVTWMDDIALCQQALEDIVQTTDEMLLKLDSIRRKIEGPLITFEGKTQAVTKWLTDWEDEMRVNTTQHSTWGQFLIEKLSTCTE